MKTSILSDLRSLALAGAALLLLAATPGHVRAAFVFTLSQQGSNVVLSGTGTLNTSALTFGGSVSGSGVGQQAQIYPGIAILGGGPASPTNFDQYSGVSGPTSFGATGNTYAASGSGSIVRIYGSGPSSDLLSVPFGYVSGTLLTDSATFSNATLATLGFVPSTYTYTWGTGTTADSLTITSVVPEPSTWTLFITGGLLLVGVAFRRRPA